jgi:hypothetical protein
MDATASVTHSGLPDVLDPLLEISLVAAFLTSKRKAIDPSEGASRRARYLPVAAQFVDKFAPQQRSPKSRSPPRRTG